MKRVLYLSVFMCCGLGAVVAGSQKRPDVRKLYAEFTQEETTDTAAQGILELARKDLHAREYLVQKLPSIIRGRPSGRVWLNAVRLAGALKAVETVPALTQALSRGPTGGTLTLGEYMRLETDAVGKALADIGDPSVPALATVLRQGDHPMRQRATLILLNIETAAARKALSEHLPDERDLEIRDLIEHELKGGGRPS